MPAIINIQKSPQGIAKVLLSVPADARVMKNTAINASSNSAKYRSPSSRRADVSYEPPVRVEKSNSSAADPLIAEATNNPPMAQLSLHTGWFETLRTTPVYEATNNATAEPTAVKATGIRMRPVSTSTNESVLNAPNTSSAHVPTEIGDQYLKFIPTWPGVVLTIICQNRSGCPKSIVSKPAQATVSGNALRYAMRTASSERGRPESRNNVASVYDPPANPARKKYPAMYHPQCGG